MSVRQWMTCVVVCLLVAGISVSARQAGATASVRGTVVDQTDAAVPAASVRLVNGETGQVLESPPDARGRFLFAAVPVGRYRFSVVASGFATATADLTLAVGQALDVPVRLVLATAERVSVEAETPRLDAARTAVAEVVTPEEIDTLPLNGRNYLDLALLAANVSRTNTRSNERFAETSAVPGTGVSVAGQRNLGNTFIVDGLSANDDAADLAGTTFSEEVIREFQVVTSGGTAEFGRASAGIVNVVTQSGTNRLRGRVYGFFRDARWDARNAFATRQDPLSQRQYGATAGGPIARDRVFFFGNVERTNQEKNGVVTIAPANAAAIAAALAQAGYGGPGVDTGEFLTGYDTTNVFGRVDGVSATGGRVQVRYSLYDVSSRNARGVGGLSAVSRGTSLENTDHTIAGTWSTALGRAGLHELRAHGTSSTLSAPPNDRIGPALTISGVANLGTSTSSPTGRAIDTIQVADTVAVQRGAHVIKAGADVIYNRVAIEFPGALQGTYAFTSLGNLQRGVYQQFQQAFGVSILAQRNPNLGVFVQDEWRMGGGLTMNAGVRYDLQWLPSPVALDADNVSPRVGVAWAAPDRRTVVRGSAGLYFDRIPLRAVSNALQRDGVQYQVAVLSFGQEGAPVFPNVLPTAPGDLVSAVTTIDPRIQNGRSRQAALQVEHAVGDGLSVSATYQHVRGTGIIMSRNVNVPTLTAAEAAARGVPNLGRPDPRFANVSRYESIGESWFDGVTVSLGARTGAWGRTRVSYTVGWALDTAGNAFFNTPQDAFDVAAEKGPSDNDQRQRLVVSGSLETAAFAWGRALGGLEFGYLVAAASGVPFNVLAGSDLNQDTNNNDRPADVGRNSARQPATATVDLRLTRRFTVGRHRLQAMLEAFNVLNRVNVLVVNNVFGVGPAPLPAFGQPTTAADPRQLQVGLRWEF